MSEEIEQNSTNENEVKMQIYEVGFHIIPHVSTEELMAKFAGIKSLIQKSGATIISEDSPKNKNLAYTLFRMIGGIKQKFNNAFFGWVKFEAPSSSIKTIKQELDKNESVIRFLIIKTVRENTIASLNKLVVREKVPMPATDDAKSTIKEKNKEVLRKTGIKAKISEEEIDKEIEEMITA
jgi:ribosomal protein S6